MANKENDKLKKFLRHYIDLDFYANTVDKELMELFEELELGCDEILSSQQSYGTKNSYNLIHKAVKEGIEDFGDSLEERLNSEADIVKEKELDFLSKMYGTALAVNAIDTSRILFAPINDKDTVKQFVDRTEKNLLRSYDNAMRAGYLFGQSSQDVKEQAKRNVKQVVRGMENGIKSAIPSFAKTTDRVVFLNNKKEVVWISVLDGNECIVCGSLHGTRYPSVSAAPTQPHFGCRCFLQPVEDITEPIPTYEEYIESLSEEEQYHILGKSRFELWKDYNTPLKRFINNGKKLRLDEIDMTGLSSRTASDEYKKAAQNLFPNEKWNEVYKNVFVAEGRNPINKNQKQIFDKELITAKIAADNGHTVYLLPEKGNNKNPDTLMDGVLTDLKKVTGNINTLGKRFSEGMEQGKAVYIQVESDFTIEQIKNKLRGEKLTNHVEDGKAYIYLKGKEYEFDVSKL